MRTFVQTRRLPENIFANFQYKSPYSSQDLNSRLSQEINSLCNRWVSIYSPFLTPWWKLQRGYVMAALHLPSRPGSAEHSASTWRVWSQIRSRQTLLKDSWGWTVIPTKSSFGPQYFSLSREMRGRVWPRRINCELPRWSSSIQQVSPWSSEESVCCWECCCSSTTLFSRLHLKRDRWKKVNGENVTFLLRADKTHFYLKSQT